MRGNLAVARQAESSEVVEVALAAALGYWEHVVSIPQRAAAGNGLHPVEGEAGDSGFASGSLERGVDGDGIGLAEVADSAVAGKNLVAEVAGVGAKPPLVDTVVRAEGATALGKDLELAPAAERQGVGSGGELVPLGAAAGQGARERHRIQDTTAVDCPGSGGEGAEGHTPL